MTGKMGAHVLVDLLDVPENFLNPVENVRKLLETVIHESKLTPVKSEFHQFDPQGVTGFFILTESHLSIHTWPEHGMAAVDIFCCTGLEHAERAAVALLKHFQPGAHKKSLVMR